MGFPYSGNFEVRTSNVTTVKKTWGDDVDLKFVGLYSGTRSVQATVFRAATDFALQTLPGTGTDDTPRIWIPDPPTVRVLIEQVALNATVYMRRYALLNSGYEVTVNANWNTAGVNANKWTQDDPARPSSTDRSFNALAGTAATTFRLIKGAAAGAWADDNVWDVVAMTCDRLGNLTTAANVFASGVPVGNAGPGILKGSRIYTTGTAVVNGDFGTFAGAGHSWGGVGFAINSVAGCDTAGSISITAGAAPNADPQFTFTFHDGTFTNTPQIRWVMSGASSDAEMKPLMWSCNATSSIVTYTGTPTNGNSYTFDWIIVGL